MQAVEGLQNYLGAIKLLGERRAGFGKLRNGVFPAVSYVSTNSPKSARPRFRSLAAGMVSALSLALVRNAYLDTGMLSASALKKGPIPMLRISTRCLMTM
ncbi:hypothetical protein GCM10023172_15530 [Hymenobacter ginsengisoli]|uniref:Uncharacterized protein n=1 Tax=Hymenobacter ginsengisoli TaxID=1051626 RepID=A0ABP8Q8G2_9BACT